MTTWAACAPTASAGHKQLMRNNIAPERARLELLLFEHSIKNDEA